MPSIQKQAAKGAVWTIGAGMGSRVLGVLSTLLLTYYIAPEDYGAVIAATAIVVTVAILSSFGLSQFLVVSKDLQDDEKFHVSLFHMLGTSTALLMLYLCREPVLAWMKTPLAGKYLPWFCLAMALERFGILPERMMSRRLQFRHIALSRAVSEIAYVIVAVSLALLGFEGMSMAYANVARFALFAIIMYSFVKFGELFKPHRFSMTVVRRIFWFGGPLAIDELSHFASRQWDNLLMGRFFGEKTTGVYNLAYNLADIPAAHVGEHIGDVLLPSFAQMDGPESRWALQRATGLLAIIVFPMAIGLAVVAPTLTVTLFDPRWKNVAPMLALLSALSIVRPIGWTMGCFLQSMSETRMLMLLGVFRLSILVAALFALRPLGPYWACAAAGLAYTAHSVGAMWMVSRKGGVSIGQILSQLWQPLAACVPMALAVLGMRSAASAVWPTGYLTLVLEIVTGALIYVVAMRVISPTLFASVIQQFKEIVLRRKSTDEDA